MKGSCLCGAITYTVTGQLRTSIACHCIQCRKTSGHYWSATQAGPGMLEISDSGSLRWYRSSEKAERGFCSTCGSSLFWRHADDSGAVSIGSGTLDGATGLKTEKHIYTHSKGDYYDIADGLPQS